MVRRTNDRYYTVPTIYRVLFLWVYGTYSRTGNNFDCHIRNNASGGDFNMENDDRFSDSMGVIDDDVEKYGDVSCFICGENHDFSGVGDLPICPECVIMESYTETDFRDSGV